MYWSSSKPPLILFATLLLCGGRAWADFPATQPTDPAEPYISRWIDQLADSDNSVRDHAEFELMGLSRDQFPLLKAAATDAMPLTPEQEAVLRDVARHVYLSAEPYDSAPNIAFLGLVHNPGISDVGLIVLKRIPGFCAYRYLRNGDIILAILDQPGVDCRNSDAFTQAIGSLSPGDTVHLRVLRQGQIQDISVVLDHAPAVAHLPQTPANAALVLQWISDRSRRADDYWQKEFAPIISDHLAAAMAN